jgi:hypothetical protein
VKRSIIEWLSSLHGKLSWGLPFHWGGGELILVAILIFGILSLGSGMVGKWIHNSGDSGLLPVTLHSLGEADYSVDEIVRIVPAIGLDIIRDLLGINEPPETGGSPEISLIATNTPSPTPTYPSIGITPENATQTSEKPESATATNRPRSTATPNLVRTATPTQTPQPTDQATLPPTWTKSPPQLTDTPIPSPTPEKKATSTPLPTQSPPTATAPIPASSTPMPSPLPAPTNTPLPTSPPQPVNTPAPGPTRSLAVTPTAKYTPGVTDGPPTLP